MISPQELIAIKQRLITAADAARQIATSPDQFVLYDEQQYRDVVESLIAAKGDVLRVFAELDVLRAMFVERLQGFLMEGFDHGNAGHAAVDVGPVQDEQDQRGSEEVRQDDAGTGGGVPESRAPRKRAKRSKPRADSPADGGVQSELGRIDQEVAVDGSQNEV